MNSFNKYWNLEFFQWCQTKDEVTLFLIHNLYFVIPNGKHQCNRGTVVWLNTGTGIINRGNQTHKLMTLVSSISSFPGQRLQQTPPLSVSWFHDRCESKTEGRPPLSSIYFSSPQSQLSSCNSHQQTLREASAPQRKEKQTRMMAAEVK